jgi:hypothetical protein
MKNIPAFETRSDIVSEEVLQFVITATINRVASFAKGKSFIVVAVRGGINAVSRSRG